MARKALHTFQKNGVPIAFGCLICTAIVLAFKFPQNGDKFFQALTAFISAYIAFQAFSIARLNSIRVEQNELESRSPHFRVLSMLPNEARTEVIIRLQNGGGTMVLEWDWIQSLNESANNGLILVKHLPLFPPMFPNNDPAFNIGMGGYPVYITPKEHVNLKFRIVSPDAPLGTGTQINVEMKFWDLKAGVYRRQAIKDNLMIVKIDTGPAIAEK